MWHNKELLTQTNQKSLLRSSVWIITLVLTILRTSKRRESRNRTLVINLYILTVCLSHWDDPTKGACRRRSSSPSPHATPVRRPRFVSELRSLPIDLSQLTSFYESPRVPSCTCCHDLSAGRWEGYSIEVNAINICYLTTLLLSSLPLRNSYLRNGDLESRFFFSNDP